MSERSYMIGDADEHGAYLERDCRKIAELQRCSSLNELEWQRLIDLVAAAPRMLVALREIEKIGTVSSDLIYRYAHETEADAWLRALTMVRVVLGEANGTPGIVQRTQITLVRGESERL